MKNFLLILLLVFCISCETENVKSQTTEISIEGSGFKIYNMDGCEYLGSSNIHSNVATMAHRGQCIYCRERQIKLIDSLIKSNR